MHDTTSQVANIANGLTAHIAACARGDILAALPDAALTSVRTGIADCLGVMVAGAAEPAAAVIRQLAGGALGREARLIPDGTLTSAREAALVNGVAAHVLDYDDVAMDGHPTAVMLPAILAEAEHLGANGGDIIAAYVAGYEAWALLRATAAVPLHSIGWHPTGVFGSIAAAIACARLRRLDAGQMMHAMGLAAAQAAGLMGNFGTMAKSFQSGRAAESGLLAARLAQAGMTARLDLFDRHGAFAQTFSGGSRHAAVAAFGQPGWALLEDPISIKIYPVCYAAHRLVDAALALQRAGGFELARIARVEAHVGGVSSRILHAAIPGSVLEAKFSAEFVIASALAKGRMGLAELHPDCLTEPTLLDLMRKTSRHLTDDVGDNPPHAPFDRVILRMENGAVLKSPAITHPSGSPQHPVGKTEVLNKFIGTTAQSFSTATATAWFNRIWHMNADTPVADILPWGRV